MSDNLKHYLQITWIKSNHRKYHHLFDEWVKNITPNQIRYFTKDMEKSIELNNI
jgi:hypothetical protein